MSGNKISTRIFSILFAVVLTVTLLIGSGATPVHAISGIIVNTLDGGAPAADGHCSLSEAINNANSNSDTTGGQCAAGTGNDTINFTVSGTITLTANLPAITDAAGLVINGNNITVDGNNLYVPFSVSAPLTLNNMTLTQGSAFSGGAAAIATGGSLTIIQSTISDNTATASCGTCGGGAVFVGSGTTLTVNISSFVGNSAAGYGGAIHNNGGTVTVANSTFTGDSAVSGGGVASSAAGTTWLINDTFQGNDSSSASDAADVYMAAGTLHLHNSILGGPTTGEDCKADGGTTIDGQNNIIQKTATACGLSNGTAGNFIGFTADLEGLTGNPAYFPLGPNSAAIDNGSNALTYGGADETANVRKVAVPWQPERNGGTPPVVDMGAVEYQFSCPGSSQLYVNSSATGANDGTSWTDAFTHMQYALGTVKDCGSPNEIWAAGGPYNPRFGATDTFNIPPGAAVYGGFAGTETLRSQRDPKTNVTILSGDIDNNDTNVDGNHIDESYTDISGTNSTHVVYIDGSSTPVTSSTVLDGFTITAGFANLSGDDSEGGGLFCNGEGGVCSPTLSQLVFSGNQATYAGAVENDALSGGSVSSPTFIDVTFRGNHAASNGGAVFNFANGTSSPSFTNVTFVDNTAGGNGGAMVNAGSGGTSSPTFTNVTFFANSAAGDGGAVWNIGYSGGTSSPSFTNVTFSSNSATNGGAIENGTWDTGVNHATLKNVILWGDSATTSGDEIHNAGSADSAVDHSVVALGCSSGSSCTNLVTTDPVLDALTDNGGFTQTMALLAGSSALNTGSDSGCPATDQRGVSRPQGPHCDIGASESQFVSTTFKSVAANDGWTLESGENTNAGGSMDSAATTFNLGDDAANKQYRGILSFNTSTLPDNALIDSVKLRIKKSGVVGSDPFSSLGKIAVDIKKGTFSNNPALQKGDFQAAASQSNAALILNTLVSGWYNRFLPSGSFGFVNLLGTTQFRLRFQTGDNNNHVADYLQIFSGNAAASSRPQLVITYYLP